MANRINISFVDDVTGEDIKPGDKEELNLSWNGKDYVLDVSKATKLEISEYMDTMLANAQPVKRGRKASTSTSTNGTRRDVTKIREWARANGYQVKDRGRIHADVEAAYEKAMAS